MKKTIKTKSGFTIIELSLSMAFIAVLLVTITVIVLSIITIYQKGLSIRAVNSTGRELIDEFSRSISSAPAMSSSSICSSAGLSGTELTRCTNDDAYLLFYQQITGNTVSIKGSNVSNPPIYGVFCTGRVSYIWNTGYAINHYGNNNPVTVKNYGSDFRLLKVTDPSRIVCSSLLNGTYASGNRAGQIALPAGETPVELLDSSEDNLAFYDLRIFKRRQHNITSHSFYGGTFLLATLRGEINITGQGDYCSDEPDGLNTDFAYCALNKFNFATRATGETNDAEKQSTNQQ